MKHILWYDMIYSQHPSGINNFQYQYNKNWIKNGGQRKIIKNINLESKRNQQLLLDQLGVWMSLGSPARMELPDSQRYAAIQRE